MAVLHVMNNFDIPMGSVRSQDGSAVEHTQFTSIANLGDLRYIIRTEENPTPHRIDLSGVDLSTGPLRQLDMPTGGFADLSI